MMIGNNHKRRKLRELSRISIASTPNAGTFVQKTVRFSGFLKLIIPHNKSKFKEVTLLIKMKKKIINSSYSIHL